jgi:lambda repressor-like predicted transcriptional regulator
MDESVLQAREAAILSELRRFEKTMSASGPRSRARQGLSIDGLAAILRSPFEPMEISRTLIAETLQTLAGRGLIETLTPREPGSGQAFFVAANQESPSTS